MIIDTLLTLYDLSVLEELKKKHPSLPDANWIYAPPNKEVGFREAQRKLGKKEIFPIFFVFRSKPAIPTREETSFIKFHLNLPETPTKTVNIINAWVSYQIDFYSYYMNDMNKFNMDYFRFLKNRVMEFDFNEYGLDLTNKQEVLFEGDIESTNTIESMYEVGRYFRYTYVITLLVPLFDIYKGIPFNKIVFSIYDKNNEKYEEIEKDV